MPRRTNNSLSSVAAEDILQLAMDSSLPSTSSASSSRDVGLSSTPTVPISQSSLPTSSQQPLEFLPVSSVASAAGFPPSSTWTSVSQQALVAPSWSSISPTMSSSVSLLPSVAGLFPSVPAVSWSSPQFVSAELPVQRPDQRLSSPLVTPMVSAALPPSWSFVPGSSTPLTQASSAWVQAPPVLRAQDQNQALAQFQAQAQALAQAQTALDQAQTQAQAQAQALAQARAQAQAQALALAQMQAVTPAAVAPSLVSFPQPQAPSRVPPMPPLPQAPMSSWPAAGPSTVPPALVASAVPSLASAGFTQFPLPGIAGMTQTSIQGGLRIMRPLWLGRGFTLFHIRRWLRSRPVNLLR